MRAAVFTGPGKPITIENISIDDPGEREVLIKTSACGLCHSDLHYVEGTFTIATPAVLGHEVAGVVEQVGSGVSGIKTGDHVVAFLVTHCGACRDCLSGHPNLCQQRPGRSADDRPRLSVNGAPVSQGGTIGGLAEYLLLHENGIVRIDPDLPLDSAALVGCAVVSGVGAVLNTARIEAGSSVAVIGTGGVGLSAVQGARLGGAARIIAVDLSDDRLEMARAFGATDVVNPTNDDPVEAIKELTDGGVDYSFEIVGNPATVSQAWDSLRSGGTATVLGMIPPGVKIEILGFPLRERRLQGSTLGSARFKVDIPKYLEFYRQGRLKLDEMITWRATLDDVDEGYRRLGNGEGLRTVVHFD